MFRVENLERLKSELKTIQSWPCGELHTETEKVAVLYRAIRAKELLSQIEQIVSRN
jgi:hypothetical protein